MLLNEDEEDDDVDEASHHHLPFLSWQTLPATPLLKALCLKSKMGKSSRGKNMKIDKLARLTVIWICDL